MNSKTTNFFTLRSGARKMPEIELRGGDLLFNHIFLEYPAPHSGQSSQLSFDHDHRGAQFLPKVARSALICQSLRVASVRLRMQRVTALEPTVDNLRKFSATDGEVLSSGNPRRKRPNLPSTLTSALASGR